jgi:hypothetical protein
VTSASHRLRVSQIPNAGQNSAHLVFNRLSNAEMLPESSWRRICFEPAPERWRHNQPLCKRQHTIAIIGSPALRSRRFRLSSFQLSENNSGRSNQTSNQFWSNVQSPRARSSTSTPGFTFKRLNGTVVVRRAPWNSQHLDLDVRVQLKACSGNPAILHCTSLQAKWAQIPRSSRFFSFIC